MGSLQVLHMPLEHLVKVNSTASKGTFMLNLCGGSLFLPQDLEACHSEWAITTVFLHRTFTAEAPLHCKSDIPWLKATKLVTRTTPEGVRIGNLLHRLSHLPGCCYPCVLFSDGHCGQELPSDPNICPFRTCH